jgi:hypothetical protein
MKLYCIYDRKGELMNPPFVQQNNAMALRQFQIMVNQPSTSDVRRKPTKAKNMIMRPAVKVAILTAAQKTYLRIIMIIKVATKSFEKKLQMLTM